jgi:hypothetical protein
MFLKCNLKINLEGTLKEKQSCALSTKEYEIV